MTQPEFSDRIIAMQPTLYRVSTSILPQLADREDAVQACIEKAWRARNRLKNDEAMRAWVIRILINECYELLRRRKREVPTDIQADTLVDREVMEDAIPDLYRLFTSLPEKYRLVVMLHYVEGYPVCEVAAMLRIPANTVKTHLRRGRELLKEMIAVEEVMV